MPSVFDSFRDQPAPEDDVPLSTDDLMAEDQEATEPPGEPNPVLESSADLEPPTGEIEPHNTLDEGLDVLMPEQEGPEASTEGPERAELRDFLLERAQAREDRSLEYQEQARIANGLKT